MSEVIKKAVAHILNLLYQHQEGATSNLDTGNEECRCGHQGEKSWREHLSEVLAQEFYREHAEEQRCSCLPDPTVSHFCGQHGDPTNPGGDCK